MISDPVIRSSGRRRRIGGILLLSIAALLGYAALWILWESFTSDSPGILKYSVPAAVFFGLLVVVFAVSGSSLLRTAASEPSAAKPNTLPGAHVLDPERPPAASGDRQAMVGNALLAAAGLLTVLTIVIGLAGPDDDDGSFKGVQRLFWLILGILTPLPLVGLGLALRSLAPGWPRAVVIFTSSAVLAVLALIASVALLASTGSG